MINPPDKSESQNQANENPVDSKFTRAALSLAQENDRLRRENRILKEEREVLKKATVFFASQKP